MVEAAVVIAASAVAAACSPAPLDDHDLVAVMEGFERAIQDQPDDVVQRLLRDHARTFKGRVVSVHAAVIASPYTRENASRIYFGVDYDASHHLYLSDIDPGLHALLEHHRRWLSVVKTYPSRQLSYELPVDEPTFALLAPGERVDFECRIAALIRGKSVYCVPTELRRGQ